MKLKKYNNFYELHRGIIMVDYNVTLILNQSIPPPTTLIYMIDRLISKISDRWSNWPANASILMFRRRRKKSVLENI